MSNDFFRNMISELKLTDISIAADGKASAEFTGYIDTGSYILNAVLSGSLYGGAPNNKITAFAGEQATGKTFFVLGIVKTFLEQNPTAGVFYFDTEGAVTVEMMTSRGIDASRVVVVEPSTIQEFRFKSLKILENYEKKPAKDRPPMMFVLDSLGMLSTTKEMEDSLAGSETKDMTKAATIKAAFRVLTLRLAKVGVPMLVTNHVYAAVGSYVPMNEIAGGSGLKYAASTIATLSKTKERDSNKEVVGNLVKIRMYKSRLSKENAVATVKLSYVSGLDRYYGLLELAEKYGIFKKDSTRYILPNGTKIFGKTINENPESYYTPEIMIELEKAANREFKYGMIGIDDEQESDDGDN